ncbi:hypothetical protein D3C80_1556600 [compost metagenome]
MDCGSWQITFCQANDLKEALPIGRRLAASKPQFASIFWNEGDQTLDFVKYPRVISSLRRLRTHKAVMITLFGNQDAVVR